MEIVNAKTFNSLNPLIRRSYIAEDWEAILINGRRYKPSQLNIQGRKIIEDNPIKEEKEVSESPKPGTSNQGKNKHQDDQEPNTSQANQDRPVSKEIKVKSYLENKVRIFRGEEKSSILLVNPESIDGVYVKSGNVFDAQSNIPIFHSIGADYTFGAGFAKSLNLKYNLRKMMKAAKQQLQVGDVVVIETSERKILNLVTKAKSDEKPAGSKGFKQAIRTLSKAIEYEKIKNLIGPLVETGLNGLELTEVREILNSGLQSNFENGVKVVLFDRSDIEVETTGYVTMRQGKDTLTEVNGITSKEDFIIYINTHCVDCNDELQKLRVNKRDAPSLFKPKPVVNGKITTRFLIGACNACKSSLDLDGPFVDIIISESEQDKIEAYEDLVEIQCSKKGYNMIVGHFKDKLFTRYQTLTIKGNVSQEVEDYLSRFTYEVIRVDDDDPIEQVVDDELLEDEDEENVVLKSSTSQLSLVIEPELNYVDQNKVELNQKSNEEKSNLETQDSQLFLECDDNNNSDDDDLSIVKNDNINSSSIDTADNKEVKLVNVMDRSIIYAVVYPDEDQINLQLGSLRTSNAMYQFVIASAARAADFSYPKLLEYSELFLPLVKSEKPLGNEIIATALQDTLSCDGLENKDEVISLFFQTITAKLAQLSLEGGKKFVLRTFYSKSDHKYWIIRTDL